MYRATSWLPRRVRTATAAAWLVLPMVAAAQQRPNQANWALSDKFSPDKLRPVVYTSTVNARFIVEEDPIEAYEQLRKRLRGDELILLKGSRGVALERLLPRLAEDLGVSTPHGEAARLGARSPHAGESEGASSQGHSHWNAEHGSKSDPAPGGKE